MLPEGSVGHITCKARAFVVDSGFGLFFTNLSLMHLNGDAVRIPTRDCQTMKGFCSLGFNEAFEVQEDGREHENK
jgi:hypothetical protein